jgi:hypothetical protein
MIDYFISPLKSVNPDTQISNRILISMEISGEIPVEFSKTRTLACANGYDERF